MPEMSAVLPDLTVKQANILYSIMTYIEAHGFAPSTREVAQFMGSVHPNSAVTHLTALITKGYIVKVPGKARTLKVVLDKIKAGATVRSADRAE